MAFKFMVTLSEAAPDGAIYNSLRPFKTLQEALQYVVTTTAKKKNGNVFEMTIASVEELLANQQALKWRDDRERPITIWTTEEEFPSLEIRIKQMVA